MGVAQITRVGGGGGVKDSITVSLTASYSGNVY